jgi:hypothetical protein
VPDRLLAAVEPTLERAAGGRETVLAQLREGRRHASFSTVVRPCSGRRWLPDAQLDEWAGDGHFVHLVDSDVDASNAPWSIRISKNHLWSRSWFNRSQNARSERIEHTAIDTVAFNSASGGTLERPDLAYIASNKWSISTSTASTTWRIRRTE